LLHRGTATGLVQLFRDLAGLIGINPSEISHHEYHKREDAAPCRHGRFHSTAIFHVAAFPAAFPSHR
jgi:hypothetical protein